MTPRIIPLHIAKRGYTHHTVDPESGCWISGYSVTVNGYATHTQKLRGGPVSVFLAHRSSWTYIHGQIPVGMVVDHLCFNRRCVNPDHLRLLTRRENSMRKTGSAWDLGTCKWGHPDSNRVSLNWASREVRTECATCRTETNTAGVDMRKYLRRLEIAYGLGDWHTKRTGYWATLRERNARMSAVRDGWMEQAA